MLFSARRMVAGAMPVVLMAALVGCPDRTPPAPRQDQPPAPPAATAPEEASGEDSRVWVAKVISGGTQCGQGMDQRGGIPLPSPAPPEGEDTASAPPKPAPPKEPSPPSPPKEPRAPEQPPSLESIREGVPFTVFDARRSSMAVCRACGCPRYAFSYELLIDRGALTKAQAAGFSLLESGGDIP